MRKAPEPKRRLRPDDIHPMHHIEEVGGRKEAHVFEDTRGEFEIQTDENIYSLPDDEINIHVEGDVIIQKMRLNRYRPRDVDDMNPVDEAGIRGGIHSENTFLVRFRDGSEWFYKVGVGEERDELFAYELAAMLFNEVVPEVRLADLGRGIGSIMRRVDGVQATRVDGLHGYMHSNPAVLDDLANMVVLDFLTGNTDRHEGNWFLTHDVRIKAIDNGFVGRDPRIDFRRCLRPAKACGVYHDPDLWPEFLLKLAETAQDAAGSGKEVRILADRVGLHAKEAIDLANLWEIKLQGLLKAVQKELAQVGTISKARVYVPEGDEPPKGVKVTEGPRGGKYYEPAQATQEPEEKPGKVYHVEYGFTEHTVKGPEYQTNSDNVRAESAQAAIKIIMDYYRKNQPYLIGKPRECDAMGHPISDEALLQQTNTETLQQAYTKLNHKLRAASVKAGLAGEGSRQDQNFQKLSAQRDAIVHELSRRKYG